MCTASWSVGQGRLSLCFNRDERKTRGEALAPAVIDRGGTRLIAAIDPDAGGTWLAVNEHGVCVYVLNPYGALTAGRKAPGAPASRGELPLRFAARESRGQAVSTLLEARLERYPPFLIAVADGEAVETFWWDGLALRNRLQQRAFLTTSSYRTEEIEAYRESRYDALSAASALKTSQQLLELHVGTPHPDPAFNPMMLREDARTRSVSRVEIDGEAVTLRHQAVVGETRGLGTAVAVSLPRRRRPGGAS